MGGEDVAGVTRRLVVQLGGAALALPAAPFSNTHLEKRRMSFTPTFVDLVRNYTITQGIVPFVLGPPVQGFTSFSAALQPGDSFYYSAIGVDKPNEREVGRGTLQADGTISRTPIAGPATSFTAGSKTIALIAAAEWFNLVQSGAGTGGGAATAASCSELASTASVLGTATLTQAGRAGVFVFDSSNLSSRVSADAAQGVYVAPNSDKSGASGAWVRAFDGPHNVKWFGAAGDGATNDGPAFTAALAYLTATAQTVAGVSFNTGGRELLVPQGSYFLGTTTLDIYSTLRIRGEGTGEAGGAASMLSWAAGTSGIRVQRYNTFGTNGRNDALGKKGGDASIIEGLYLKGGFAGTEGEYHGIQLRARATVRDCVIDNFAGDGVYIGADHTSGDGATVPQGNANGFHLERLRITGCRTAVTVIGGDANAGTTYAIDIAACRQHGINDSSFLGNSHYGAQAANCSLTSYNDGVNIGATVVSNGTNRYSVIAGQAAGASTNAPSGTTANNSWWRYENAGGVSASVGIPLWTSGMLVREGYPYYATNNNARVLFSNPYFEGAQAPIYLSKTSMVLGGSGPPNVAGANPNQLCATQDGVASKAGLVSYCYDGTSSWFARLGEVGARTALMWSDASAGNFWRIKDTGSGDWKCDWANLGADVSFLVSGSATAQQFGTGAAYAFAFAPYSLMVMDNAKGIGNARRLMIDSAVPASGAHGQGEFVLYRGASAGLIGWKCTGAGTPGTWEALYSGYGTAPIGYASGAGGAAVQATSKSTGVTLNKLSGKITMNAASLAAGTAVGFVLTNSQIAASDVVVVSIASGATADSYTVGVDAVGAGSCRISLRNLSGGALAEAVVLNFAVIKAVNA